MASKASRPVRPSALRSVQNTVANGSNPLAGQGSSEEDEEMPLVSRPPQRASSRRAPKVDFAKLDTSSLQKYRKVHRLAEAPASTTKDDLIPAVSRHFSMQQVTDEEDILYKFAFALRKHSLENKTHGPAKRPRNAAKPKTR